jgi:putative nucleotidyltransferase with HDIG domain
MNDTTKSIREDIAKAIGQIPLLPTCASQLLATLADSRHSLADVVNVVRHDAALTANLLKLANSALYGARAEITSIERAIAIMGEEAVVNATMSDSAKGLFLGELTGYEGDAGSLWRHDLRTAIASRHFAGLCRERLQPETAFTGGLLHDLGKPILSRFLGTASPVIVEAIEQGRVKGFPEAEEKILGTDHAQVGADLAQRWNLPEVLRDIIRFHHAPAKAPEPTRAYAYAVHLGDMIAMLAGCGTGADSLRCPLDRNYEAYIPVTKQQIPMIILDVEEEFQKISRIIFPEEVGL